MEVTIRKAVLSDFARILELIQEFAHFQKTPELVTISLAQLQTDADYFQAQVAVVEGTIIGFATYYLAYHSWSGKALHLDDLYVQTPFRGQKIGQQLMDRVIAIAREKECKKVEWMVSSWNVEAIAYYRHLGAELNEVDQVCYLYL